MLRLALFSLVLVALASCQSQEWDVTKSHYERHSDEHTEQAEGDPADHED